MIADYVSSKPASWKDRARYLATDLLAPGQARLKVYLRALTDSSDELWDLYTLGGHISELDHEKDMFRDLVELTTTGPGSTTSPRPIFNSQTSFVFYSITPDSATPVPNMYINPGRFASSNGAIARGLDTWLRKYDWPFSRDGDGKSLDKQVRSVFTHRNPDDKTGIITFVGLGSKEDPKKKNKELRMRIYVMAELYAYPRLLGGK